MPSPLLSFVVPVYQVEELLPYCLDSILAEPADLEVVAVDDQSADGSGAILDRYARRDLRVQVVHLAANVGLGRARNAGLERATGEYVWFVDSDDWLPPGSVPAVLRRLAAATPDVLIVDHVEVRPDGWALPTGSGAARPGRVVEWPELLRRALPTSSCTKVIRRTLLDRTGLRFPPGWYEDCAFTFPLLLAADRVEVLDRVCYCYRQRVVGAITKSVSPQHFDVFGQYERMWQWVDRAGPVYDSLRPELFRLMIDHLLVIAGNDRRLPPARRREFFGRIAETYRQRLPAGGYHRPGGLAGLKHRLVRGDAYPAYAALRLARRGVGKARAGPGADLAPAGRYALAPAASPDPARSPASAPWSPNRRCSHTTTASCATHRLRC